MVQNVGVTLLSGQGGWDTLSYCSLNNRKAGFSHCGGVQLNYGLFHILYMAIR